VFICFRTKCSRYQGKDITTCERWVVHFLTQHAVVFLSAVGLIQEYSKLYIHIISLE